MKSYLPTIGLEIHAELKTETKMFCSSKNAPFGALPNTHVCPICMGHPGTLPTVNKRAVESVIMMGLALGGTIATYTEFDRKNYFYPDIPKGYQISQYAYPLVKGGLLLSIPITRVHLEEDTARSLHDDGEGTCIDYNRAGVPLMELVTEPNIHDAETASLFAKELQLLLRTLGISDADMEKGQMRVEANVSVGTDGILGTKVEVKNLNSFKSVELAIAYEIKRQIETIEGGGVVVQETRGWDENKGSTFSQRKKESSHDYRYFPDPDIPKARFDVGNEINISRISDMMPELPSKIREKYINLGITRNLVETLTSNIELQNFLKEVYDYSDKRDDTRFITLAVNYLTTDILGILSTEDTLSLKKGSSRFFSRLMELVHTGIITSRVAKDMLVEVVFNHKDPEELIKEKGLAKKSSEELGGIIDMIVEEYAEIVLDYKNGKTAVLQFLVGQGMRKTKGAADPEELRKMFIERIK